MFEILQALMALSKTAGPYRTHWRLEYEGDHPGEGPVLRIEIPLTDDEARFTEGMQALFAPLDEKDI